MAQKANIRSIRISDKMAELIDRQAGSNFTEKWENLVTRCVWELPRQEERLKAVQEQIRKEQQRLWDLQRATEQLQMLEMDIQNAQRSFKLVERRAKQIADTVEQDAGEKT